uniref:Major sperm protein n=1 Tax=Angiostrongylus cantonensis TaxID=6313 RepID=A0A0K0DDA1_ANGCA
MLLSKKANEKKMANFLCYDGCLSFTLVKELADLHNFTVWCCICGGYLRCPLGQSLYSAVVIRTELEPESHRGRQDSQGTREDLENQLDQEDQKNQGVPLLNLVDRKVEGKEHHQRIADQARVGSLDIVIEARRASPLKRRSKSQRSRKSSRSSKGRKVVSSSTPAKPSELRVEPAELSYKAIGGLKGVNIVNDTNERKFFKVRCSDNMLYRVNPVFGVVEPGRSSRIDILRQNGAAKIDKMVLVTTRAAEGELPSREAFIRAKNTEMMVLPLLVQE